MKTSNPLWLAWPNKPRHQKVWVILRPNTEAFFFRAKTVNQHYAQIEERTVQTRSRVLPHSQGERAKRVFRKNHHTDLSSYFDFFFFFFSSFWIFQLLIEQK